MASVKIDSEHGYVTVKFPNDKENEFKRYPFVWLRDNCQCSECYDSNSRDRRFSLSNLDVNVEPVSAKLSGDAGVSVFWPDGHESTFALEWLWQRRFERESWDNHDKSMQLQQRLWKVEDLQNGIPKVDYEKFLKDDHALFDWLANLEILGICLITNAPKKLGVVKDIGARISHLTPCHYGETAEVQLDMSASNLAFSSNALGLHTDFPNLEYSPEMQMLHCIQQAQVEGGDSTLVDAIQVANDMRLENEDCFKTLCDTLVNFEDTGTFNYPFHLQSKKPTFKCDKNGKVVKVMYSNPHRDSVMTVPVERVKPFYTALALFEKMINDPKYCIHRKLQPGEIICFDNFRLMHGREAFKETKAGERHLEGAYIGWDYLKSRRRVLQNKLAISHEMLQTYYI